MRHEGDIRRRRTRLGCQGRGATAARALREETGGILAVSAALLPMLLVLCALVIDVGNWFTHKRQLQNRADAAALAAGVEYGNVLGDCLQTTDATAKTAAAAAITAQARRYAGDPAASDPVNIEIADQTKLDVLVNSSGYGTATDGTDGGDPCFDHAGDDVSPGGGQWTDVRVVERDLPSLFGIFGLPLARNGARARVEIRPAVSDNGFIPLAIPETEIVKAQLRYYDHCTSPPTPLGAVDLGPLPDEYQTVFGTVLWGPREPDGLRGDPFLGVLLDVPAQTDCGLEYVPVGAEVRVAGREAVDFDQTCGALAAARFADCWSRLSEIRVWKDRPGAGGVWIQDVELTSNSAPAWCQPDAQYARATAPCDFGVRVNLDWGSRAADELAVPANFAVTVNGTSLRPDGPVNGWWSSEGSISNDTRGGAPVTLDWSWEDDDRTHDWNSPSGTVACTNGNTPCRDNRSGIPIHRTFRADDDNAGIVDLVRTSGVAQFAGDDLRPPLSSIYATGVSQRVYPTVGLRSALRAGQYRVLRAAGPQGNQSVDCEPTGGQGHDFEMFMTGCDPYYGINRFAAAPDIWWGDLGDCPRQNVIFAQPNDPHRYWKCVPAAPGFSPGVIADGIAARTGNCTGIQANTCNRTACLHPSNYPVTPDPNWVPPLGDPRVVSLFVVPYGAFKGVNAADGLPITKFPKFYVTGWGGNGANRSPCPDDDPAEPGEIVGYFIAFGQPGGPVDETLKCIAGDLTPCRAVLVR